MNSEPILLADKQPQSSEAEEAVLGAVLIDGEILNEIAFLEPTDFYIERNRWVFQAARDLRALGSQVDYITVAQYLENADQLVESGGPARLMQLINRTPTSLNGPSYAKIVKDMANRRRVLAVASQLAAAAFDTGTDLRAATGTGLDALSRSMQRASGAVHISQFLDAIKDEVDQARAHPATNDVWGIPTGLAQYDAITGGLHPGEVTKLAGDPGIGKSLLLMQMICAAAERGHPSVLYELEMGGKQVLRRSLSAFTHLMQPDKKSERVWLATRAMQTGRITEDQYSAFLKALERMAGLPIYLSDNANMTTGDLRVDLISLIENFGVELVGIDYEALLGDEAENTNEHSKIVSNRVHALAKDLNVAIVSLGDMIKEGIQGKVSGQGAMAGTAREMHNADQIIFLRKTKLPSQVAVVWEKFRDGDGEHGFNLLKLPGFPVFGEVDNTKGKDKDLPF